MICFDVLLTDINDQVAATANVPKCYKTSIEAINLPAISLDSSAVETGFMLLLLKDRSKISR